MPSEKLIRILSAGKRSVVFRGGLPVGGMSVVESLIEECTRSKVGLIVPEVNASRLGYASCTIEIVYRLVSEFHWIDWHRVWLVDFPDI